MSSDLINVTWLFRIAQDWYINHPDEQIPHEMWNSEVNELKRALPRDQTSSADTLRPPSAIWLYVHADVWKVTNIAPEMIPVLAGISLSFSTEALAKVTRHHNIKTMHLTNLRFEQDHSLASDFRDEDMHRPITDAWTVTEAVVRALCFEPDSADEFVKACTPWTWRATPELRVATLLVDEPRLWPSTFVQQSLASFRAGKETPHVNDQFISTLTLNECSKDFVDFTPAQLRTILERSGHLELGASMEYGFRRRFFADILFAMGQPTNTNAKVLGRVLNQAEDPALLDRLRTRLCESLSEFTSDDNGLGTNTVERLQSQLDNLKYANVLDDIMLKINVLPLSNMTGERTAFESGSAFDAFYNEPSSLLARLADRLLATEPEDFRSAHFKALARLQAFGRARQNPDGVDMTGLVTRTMKGLMAYHEMRHFEEGLITNDYKKEADEWVSTFLKSVANIGVTYDYKQFSDLTSSDKRLMASAGFDIKKLPGMNTRDRGQVLTDQLGL
jgi:hypothetical protein